MAPVAVELSCRATHNRVTPLLLFERITTCRQHPRPHTPERVIRLQSQNTENTQQGVFTEVIELLCLFFFFFLVHSKMFTCWQNVRIASTLPGQKKQKLPAKEKRSHTLIFRWINFSFDYRAHSLWHCFDKLLQCHKIYFRPVLHSFFSKILFWWWESWTTAESLLQHIPKILNGVKVWTLWWPIHVWKRCLMLPEPLFHNLSPMNPGIVNLEYARAIREEKINSITPEQGKSRLIRPHDLLPLLQSPIFMLPSKLKPFFWLASLISGFLKATHLFSPNPLSSLSVLNIALSSTVVFLRFVFIKHLSNRWSRSIRIFFRPHFFLEVMLWTVLNPLLVVSAIFYRLTSFPQPRDAS